MTRSLLKYWLPVVLWLALIFSASADKASGHRSSRIIAPIVRWLVPNISQKNLETIVYSVRKTAHLTEYAVLALLLWRALASFRSRRDNEADSTAPSGFPWRAAAIAFALATLYAITDEFHQTFVPSRQGQALDVFIDAFGAALGLLGLWLVGRWRKCW